MKKTAFTIASVLAATAFAPEASAIPAFARQTGMACMACHQQHFPVLNSFGQSFKSSGYTLMGAEAKVEGEHLSIPATLNAAVLLKARYQKTNGTNTGLTGQGINNGAGTNTNNGQWQFGDEFSLFFGGRVSENIGFMLEGNLNGSPNPAALTAGAGGGAQSSLVAGLKIPFMFDIGDAKVGLIPFSTDILGVAYGFELASTGAVRNVRWAEHRRETAAQQYVNTASAASGLAFVARNDMGYINYSRWSPNHLPGANGGTTASTNFTSNYLRIAATPTVGDWAMQVGAQFWSGASEVLNGAVAGGVANSALRDTKAQAVDFQAFGNIGGNDVGVYATYAKADAPIAGRANLFGAVAAAPNASSAFTVGGDYSVIPHTLHLGAAYRSGNNGALVNNGDNALTLMAVYDVAQNVALHVNYSKYSGSAYNVMPATGDSLLTGLLEMAW